MNPEGLKKIFLRKKTLLAVYIIFSIAATAGQFLKQKPGDTMSRINNFLIFRESFQHLKDGKDLYAPYPGEYADLYKYSPSFPVFMAPFRLMNDFSGALMFNLLNSLPLLLVLLSFPMLRGEKSFFVAWFILLELLTNMQNHQSNGLTTALLAGAFLSFEKRIYALAALCIVFSGYIKVFGFAAGILFFLYPGKLKFIGWSLFWFILIGMLPLLFTTPDLLLLQYMSWFDLLEADRIATNGISLTGILHSWFQINPDKNLILMTGIVMLILPLFRLSRFSKENFRLEYFSLLLLWLVLFNHRAESPTYIISITGIALWYVISSRSKTETALLLFAFVLTSLSPTDLFPRYIRNEYIIPYSLKALPTLVIFIYLLCRMMFAKNPVYDLYGSETHPPNPENVSL